MPLNSYQLNMVRCTLKGYEESLRSALDWLDREPEQGILYRRSLEISAQRRERVRKVVEEELEQISTLAARLGIEAEDLDMGQALMGMLSVSWTTLADCRVSQLRGFGEIDPQAGKMVDEAAQRMAHGAMVLSRLLTEKAV